jgi:hypothetical protein
MDFPRTVEWVRDDGLDAVEAAHAAALRANAFEFWAQDRMDVDVTFTSTDMVRVDLLAESINSSGSTYPDPTEIVIQTTTPHRIGQTTNDGLAEIRFGAGGPVFTTQGPDTFFEFEVSSVYEDGGENVASGTFSLIARNRDDASDLRRILVMDGAFILRE